MITPVIITFNEEANLRRVLERLTWAHEIIVVDSFSTDATATICAEFANVRFVQNLFESPAKQFNLGADAASTPWIFALGADYVMSPELIEELKAFSPPSDVNAYRVSFRYCIEGRPLRANLYPSGAMLYRRDAARFEQDGHTERLVFEGAPGELTGKINHDDRKPLDRWFTAQIKYSKQEAAKILAMQPGEGRRQDRIRRLIVIAPPLILLYTLFWKGLILDGWHGWMYVLQRVVAEIMLSLRLIEQKLMQGNARVR